jgi:hypothetical protein
VTLPTGGGLPPNLSLANWTGDYIQITDDLLPSTDPYWTVASGDGLTCWDGTNLAGNPGATAGLAQQRYNACDHTFQTTGDSGYNVNTVFSRDFPIIEAFDDQLVLGRFYWPPTVQSGTTTVDVVESNTNRIIVGPDPGNVASLKFAQCCFHSLAGFSVRGGGEWIAAGSGVGFLHHVETDPKTGRCVPSTDPRLALLNGRSFDIPWAQFSASDPKSCNNAPVTTPPTRDSILAMRNPMFSYVTWSGCGMPTTVFDHTTTVRDDFWRFAISGSFVPLTVSLTQGTNVPVSPQSMLFISPLQQLAVVDGAQQGLVVIDLNSLGFAHAPYF